MSGTQPKTYDLASYSSKSSTKKKNRCRKKGLKEKPLANKNKNRNKRQRADKLRNIVNPITTSKQGFDKFKSFVLVVDGNIGSGKTTFINSLVSILKHQTTIDVIAFSEVVHELPVLQDFIRCPHLLAHDMQLACAKAYVIVQQQVSAILEEKKVNCLVIMERSLWSVLMIFASALHMKGFIAAEQIMALGEEYRHHWNTWLQNLPVCHVWYNTSPALSLERYNQRKDPTQYPWGQTERLHYWNIVHKLHASAINHFHFILNGSQSLGQQLFTTINFLRNNKPVLVTLKQSWFHSQMSLMDGVMALTTEDWNDQFKQLINLVIRRPSGTPWLNVRLSFDSLEKHLNYSYNPILPLLSEEIIASNLQHQAVQTDVMGMDIDRMQERLQELFTHWHTTFGQQ
jgi:deoxyadenosine/deoxycytidine kinase